MEYLFEYDDSWDDSQMFLLDYCDNWEDKEMFFWLKLTTLKHGSKSYETEWHL